MSARSILKRDGTNSGAMLSDEKPRALYRYRLWREWGGDNTRRCVFVGINPSTADATKDDATIRKCIGFSKRWGFGALDMINLFAWRDTDQLELLRAKDPIGEINDLAWEIVFEGASRIVWAWGRGKSSAVRNLIDARKRERGWISIPKGCQIGTLGLTDDGYPKHPLMLSYNTKFIPTQAFLL